MGKVVSKVTNNEGRVRLNINKRSQNYKNLTSHPNQENDHVVEEENEGGEDCTKDKQRKVDALLQLKKRPVSAFIHSGTDGLYVWFISTWMRLKQKHYGKLSNDTQSSTSSRSSSRKHSPDHIVQPKVRVIERTDSQESNDLDLADISDNSCATDSGRSSAGSDDNHLDDLDMYSIKYFNETVNDFHKEANPKSTVAQVRTLGSRNPSFSLNE